MNGYMYILKSERNNRYYIGSTNDLERRLMEHSKGQAKATARLIPLKLVYQEEYSDLLDARRRENQIKKWKSRKMIEELILNMGQSSLG